SPRTVPAPDNEIGAWRISDFITLGSPMTYGPFLLADSASEFEAQARKHRRFSLCPPDGAWEDGALRFSFKDTDGALNMHHSALFGAVRWTNIHFATKGLIRGDIIGGPVGHIFGSGVVDIECDPAETLKTFAHNEYWRWPGDKDGAQWLGGQGRAFRQCPRYLLALRRALNLFDDPTEEQLLLKMSRGEV
ncbi:MAG TPA: hypothetical protein VM915_12485, partial [Verrucomicrobiae bacterium]|nr:hypothetical protein [Verrucomicrobiae bacterium]